MRFERVEGGEDEGEGDEGDGEDEKEEVRREVRTYGERRTASGWVV